MSEKGAAEERTTGLKFKRVGTWEDMVEISQEIGSLLESLNPEDFEEELPDNEFEELSREWDEWRPRTNDAYSHEMRKKTAKQCSLRVSEPEKGGNGTSGSPNPDNGKTEGNGGVKHHPANAIEKAKEAVNSKIRKGIRTVEENIYEKVMLKTNALYFDNCVLNAVLSRKRIKNPSSKYRLEIYSNNPQMRQIFASRIDWDGH